MKYIKYINITKKIKIIYLFLSNLLSSIEKKIEI